MKYSVTKVKGAYIENYGTPKANEVGESVFFVIDIFCLWNPDINDGDDGETLTFYLLMNLTTDLYDWFDFKNLWIF